MLTSVSLTSTAPSRSNVCPERRTDSSVRIIRAIVGSVVRSKGVLPSESTACVFKSTKVQTNRRKQEESSQARHHPCAGTKQSAGDGRAG